MRKPFIAAVLAIAWALVASANAQTAAPTAAPAATEVSGTVMSTGNVMMLVRGDDGQDRSLVLFNTTQMADERILAGDRVKVRYRPIDGERFEAVSVERAATEAAPGAAAAQTAASESAGFSVPAVATISSLAWLVLALGVTVFVAAYLVSVRRHHHHHMH
jgi:translation initiation factor IF-1